MVDPGQDPRKVTFRVREDGTDYLYDGPDELTTGLTEVVLDNDGRLPHQVNIARLKDGVTPEEVIAAAAGPNPTLAFAYGDAFIGGPNGNDGGTSTQSIVDFDQPGHYMMVCFLASPPDFKPHIGHGMVKIVKVSEPGTPQPPSTPPTAVDEIVLKDYGFLLPDGFTGKGWYRVTNEGPQFHEMSILRVKEGRSVEDVRAAVNLPEGAPRPDPPYTDAGGFGVVDKGRTALVKLDLAPGRYVLVCYLPALPAHGGDGRAHHVHGMFQELTIT